MSLIDLFFPQTCVFCGETLVRGEKTMCLNCHKFFRYTKNAKEEYKYKITEMPVSIKVHGESKVRIIRDTVKMLRDIIKMKRRIKKTKI